MHLNQGMAGQVGESLSPLWGARRAGTIPAIRQRQLRDEEKSGRYPIHAYQNDLPSLTARRVLTQAHVSKKTYERSYQ